MTGFIIALSGLSISLAISFAALGIGMHLARIARALEERKL